MAGSRGAHHRGSRTSACPGSRRAGRGEQRHGAVGPRHRAAKPWCGERPGVHQSRARLGLRGPQPQRLRLPHRTGQRPGRPRARAEGRPAARLSQLDNPAHRAAIAAVWDIDPKRCPPPACRRWSCSAALGGPVRGLLVLASNILVSRARCARRSGPHAGLDLLVVVDPFLSETAAAPTSCCRSAQWAEEDGTMTNLEGRVLLRRQATAAARGRLDRSRILKGLADRLGSGDRISALGPPRYSAELRARPAAGAADYAGVSYERIVAKDGDILALPGSEPTRARRGSVPRRGSPLTMAARAFSSRASIAVRRRYPAATSRIS